MQTAARPEPCELPDSVEELYPAPAARFEELRRTLLDLFFSWGYRLVVPPLLEYAGTAPQARARDLEEISFRLRDGMSPRDLLLRADLTLQTARMDALDTEPGVNRFCYAGPVLHAQPRDLLASREPFHVGAELYGSDTVEADRELIVIMAESLLLAGISKLCLDFGHVGIYRALVAAADLDAAQEERLFDALQRKAETEIRAAVADCPAKKNQEVEMLCILSSLHGDREVLETARRLLAAAPPEVAVAIDRLEAFADALGEWMPDVQCYFDLGELRGYRYHTGVVFAAYAGDGGAALANGGRCDGIGAAYGRARASVGFHVDLRALLPLGGEFPAGNGIRVPVELPRDEELYAEVYRLRQAGERVVVELPGEEGGVGCSRVLQRAKQGWQVVPDGD